MSSRGESLDGYHQDDRNQKETEEYRFHDFFMFVIQLKQLDLVQCLSDIVTTSGHGQKVVTGR